VRPHALWPSAGLLAGAGALLGTAGLLHTGPVCGPRTPGMAPYDGGPERVTLRNFSPAGPEMRFDVLIEPVPSSGFPRPH
jgi:hypothetical protein